MIDVIASCGFLLADAVTSGLFGISFDSESVTEEVYRLR